MIEASFVSVDEENLKSDSTLTTKFLACLSNAVYDNAPQSFLEREYSIKILPEDDFEFVSESTSNTQLMLIYLERYQSVCVAFRGTQEGSDWLTNAKLFKEEYHGGEVHSGFLRAYEKVAEKLYAFLAKHSASSRQTVFTGHSLGAALATIAFYDCKKSNFVDEAFAHVFGCPRVGDSNFAKDFVETIGNPYLFVSYVLGADIVTAVPLNEFGYVPTRDPFCISLAGDVFFSEEEKEEKAKNNQDSILRAFTDRVSFHSMDFYIPALKATYGPSYNS
jgi:hypothetical protein